MTNDLDLNRAIHRAINEEIERVATEEIAKAQETIARKVRARVGEIVSVVSRDFTYENIGQDLRITVRFPKDEPK